MLTVATDLETSQVPRRTDVVVTLELTTSVLLTSACYRRSNFINYRHDDLFMCKQIFKNVFICDFRLGVNSYLVALRVN